ncbi:GTP-binding protein Di-Ras2 [Hydra vulgaris]|uniref:GTP-binding protein Di-Ras2 n=1 Tax=Hydra vulgaris TaxID=6087 RepID=A0ABM4C1H9_HYDVU
MLYYKMVKGVRKSGYLFEYRFTLLGDIRTGKTSVLNRFINDTFSQRYRPTVEDHITHVIDHNGNMCVCLMVDTYGGNDFPAMRKLAISKGNAFFVFYSIVDRNSFDSAKKLVKEIQMCKEERCNVLIIGNKNDLEKERKVQTFEGEHLAHELNSSENVKAEFFEVSAKNNQNIELIFFTMLNMFMPQVDTQEIKHEKCGLRKISLRKSQKKKKQEPKEDYYSDNEFLDHKPVQYLRLRSSSFTEQLKSDSDGSFDSNHNFPKSKNDESVGKNLLQRTFGSMQRVFNNDVHRDSKRAHSIDSTTIPSRSRSLQN